MHTDIDLTIAPNDKYQAVIVGHSDMEGPAWEADHDHDEETEQAADAYADAVDAHATEMANIQDTGPQEAEDALSWADIGVSQDPDLVAKMATYFDGIYADEPTDRIRAKLRLVDVETYASVQFAAKNELRGE